MIYPIISPLRLVLTRNEINSRRESLLSTSRSVRAPSQEGEKGSRSFSPAFTLDDDDCDDDDDDDRRNRGENSLRRGIKSRMIYARAK